MRASSLLLFPLLFALAVPVSAAAPPVAAPTASARNTPAPAQIRLEMRLTRTEKEVSSGAGAPAATTDTKPAPPAPLAIGTPALTTLDRGTATVSVINKDLSYSISVSPALEQTNTLDSTVQVLWNVRFSGRALPSGTNSVTTTGATRVRPDADSETLLTELPITDAKTGTTSVFRLTVRVSVIQVKTPGPDVLTAPPTAP